MNRFLVQKIEIDNHPVKDQKESIRLQYVAGLAEFLYTLTNGDSNTKLVFDLWAYSILGFFPADVWKNTTYYKAIQKALSIHREGFHFYTLKYPFFFDCFYLLEKSGKKLKSKAYSFLMKQISTSNTKEAINHVHDFFSEKNLGSKLPEALRHHRHQSVRFSNRPSKKVLVVATMSAGKSTLVNALVGHKVCRVRSTACTSIVREIYNKPHQEGALALYTNKKYLYTPDFSELDLETIKTVGLPFTSSLKRERICLIDTPGVNFSGDKSHGEKTRKAIKDNDYDILLFVMNGTQLAIQDERDLINFIGQNCKKKVIGVINQCDTYRESQDSIPKALETGRKMMKEAGIANPLVLPISAYAAYLFRLEENPRYRMDEDDRFDLDRLKKRMSKPFFDLPSYLPNELSKLKRIGILQRSGLLDVESLLRILIL